jgi:uncharacterized protein YbcI
MAKPHDLPQEVLETLGGEILAIHEESYGRGAAKVSVHLVEDAVLVFLDGIDFHPSERFLIDRGEGEMVLRTRAAYQVAIQSTFEAAVERATGRRVISFLSATKLEPPYSLEVFRLAHEEG